MSEWFLNQIRDVVVVVSSPRGGSSLLAERLRGSPYLLHLPGETPPLLTAAGIDPKLLSGCETLGRDHAELFRTALGEQLALEVGRPAHHVDEEQLVSWLTRRVRMQWPAETFADEEIRACYARAAHAVPVAGAAARFAALNGFQLEFVAALRRGHPAVDPYYYDIAVPDVENRFPDVPMPVGPPGRRVVEVAPFLVARPWQLATETQLANLPLVVKAPGCSYQLPFWRALFPRARVRVLHLTRSCGASVHGLAVAWRHHGFFSRRVDETLRIPGYSELGPWGAHWWNFDLPPGWRDLTEEPLLRVCAFQWASAHRAVLAAAVASDEMLTVRHEDLIGAPVRQAAAMRALGDWLGLPGAEVDRLLRTTVGPVSATAAPSEDRWLESRTAIDPLLAGQDVRDIADALGYGRRRQPVRG